MSDGSLEHDNMSEASTDWEGIPMTDQEAFPKKLRDVKNVPAIRIQKGAIRNAQFENCTFELVTADAIPKMRWGMKRVEVKCLWFGRKPPTCWMNVGITGKFEIIQDFTGEVTANFGR